MNKLIEKLKVLEILAFSFLTIMFSLVSPFFAQAQLKDQFVNSMTITGKRTGHLDASGEEAFFAGKTLPGVIGSIVGVALSMLGVFFLGLIIYSGYKWMLARGNSQEIEKAKSTMINAVIGLVVVLSAYALTIFISGLF